MSEFIFLGFDVSSTGAGAALLRENGSLLSTWVWQNDDSSESVRLRSLAQWAKAVQKDWRSLLPRTLSVVLVLSMEGPFLRGKGSLPLVRAQGAVMVQFEGDWSFYQPTSVKATARHSAGLEGNLDKGAMIRTAIERWPQWLIAPPVGLTDDVKAKGDIADALWVAETDRLQVLQNRRGEE
jgi:hypothetical protein